MDHNARRRHSQASQRLAAALAVLMVVCLGGPTVCAAGHSGGAKPAQPHFSAPKMPKMPSMPNFSGMGFQMPKPAHGSGGQPQIPKYGITSAKPAQTNKQSLKAASTAPAEGTATGSTSNSANAAIGTASGVHVGRPYYHGHRYYGGRYYRSNRGYYPRHNMMSAAMRHLQRLIADLDSITPNSHMTQSQKNIFHRDLLAVVDSGPKPNTSNVQVLANDLVDTMSRRKSPMIDTKDLAWSLKAVMNSGHLAAGDVTHAIAQSQSILGNGGAIQADIKTVVNDLKMITALPNNVGQGVNGALIK
jgi:hypothetical protein